MQPVTQPHRDDDPRLQIGAYITDGTSLMEVVGGRFTYGAFGPWYAVCVEDCMSLQTSEYDADTIRRRFSLVRVAPSRTRALSVAV